MPDFSPIIQEAYLEILGRGADPGGLANYNGLMNAGMSEQRMREALLRSPEYAASNPDPEIETRLGLNVHIPSSAILQDVARNLGMRWIRVDFDWFRIEPERGRFAWDETDRVIEEARRLGVEVLATLSYTPAWASSSPAEPRIGDPPASVDFWVEIVREAAIRYRERVRFWQFWNEPNVREFWNGSITQYRTLILEPAARVLRDVHPDGRVVSPGLATLGDWRDWFREIMASAASVDVINHHNYTTHGADAIRDLERDSGSGPSLRTLMRELGVDDRAFWITETGRRTRDGNQLIYYEDVVATLRVETWVDRLFFFHYWDGPGAGNGGFGIVNEDFSPKPAYFFLQSVLQPAVRSNL